MWGLKEDRVPHSTHGVIVRRVGAPATSRPTLRTMRPSVEWGIRLLGIFLGLLCVTAHADSTRCGAGKDLVVRALERVTPSSPTGDLQDANILLKDAASECPDLGDAWYYRSLVEAKLGNAKLADYAMTKARLAGSEAMDEKLDPFVLAAPERTRGNIAAAAPSAPPVPTQPRQKWALVVGIGKFDNPRVPELHLTKPDAAAFAAFLQDPKTGRFNAANVHVLTDEHATTRAIKEQLNWLARSAAADDLVVIYMATHGSPRTMDTAGVNYIITYDTDITNQDALFATALPMVDVGNTVATRVKATRVAIFLDTCFSGAASGAPATANAAAVSNSPAARAIAPGIRTASVSGEMINRIRQGTGRVILTASNGDEVSWESDKLGHGYFTYYLLQALQKGKGQQPLREIFPELQQDVSSHVMADWHAHQDPTMTRSDEGVDIVLGAAASQAAAREPNSWLSSSPSSGN